jgi:PAS domain S-box-containing protein
MGERKLTPGFPGPARGKARGSGTLRGEPPTQRAVRDVFSRSVHAPAQSHHYLRQLFDRTQIAILVANDDGTYVDANAGACRLLGASREEIIGRSISDFIRPDLAAVVNTQWRAFLRDGEQNGLFEVRRSDGTYCTVGFYAEANFVPGFHCSFLRALDRSEDFASGESLTLCPWTKRVWLDDKWISIENFLERKLNVRIQHGMSPHALERFPNDPRARGD